MKNKVFHSIWGTLLPAFIAFLAMQRMYSVGGEELLGFMMLAFAAIGTAGIFDFGIGRAIIYFVARERELDLEISEKGKKISGSGFVFSATLGLIVAVALGLSSSHLALLIPSEKFSIVDINSSLILLSIGIPLVTAASSLRGTLEGAGDFLLSSKFKSYGAILSTGIPLVMMIFGITDIRFLISSLVFSRMVLLLMMLWGCRKMLIFDSELFSLAPSLIKHGSWLTLSSYSNVFLIYGDRYLISGMLGAASFGYYAFPQEVVQRSSLIPSAISNVFYSEHSSGSNLAERSIGKYQMMILLYALVLFFGIILFWHGFIEYTFDSKYAQKTQPIAIIMGIGLIFNSLAQMPYSKLLGHGMAKQTSILHIVELLIYIPSLYYFTSGFGILGASSVWSGRMLIDLIAMTIMINYIPPKKKS